MKAIIFEKYGPPEVLQLKELENPVPGENEVLVRVRAASVIVGDCEMREFRFPWWFWLFLRLYVGLFRPKRVRILGQELAGVIAGLGKGVKGFNVGDEVFGPVAGGMFGAHAEYALMRADKAIAKKPVRVPFTDAACITVGGLNALHFLKLAKIQPNETVLVNGGGGNIGNFAVQIAKTFGAEVTAVDSTSKLAMLKKIGADHVIDYTKEDFTSGGKKYDVIFDVIGKATYSRCLRSLKPNGRYLIANPKLSHMIRSVWTTRTSDRTVIFRLARYHRADLEFLADLARAGKLKPWIDKTFPLEKTADAHRYVDSAGRKGNVVIKILK